MDGGSKVSRADLHIHTTFSDGVATPEDVLNHYAMRADFNAIAITDHDTLDGALHAAHHARRYPDLYGHLEIIVGEEVSSTDGHVLGLFLREWVPPGMDAEKTVKAIHDQGGIAVAPHPYTRCFRWTGLVGVGDLIRRVPFDAVETRNSNFTEVLANGKADRRSGDKARVGGSDGHFLSALGRCFTEFPGSSAEDLRKAILERKTRALGATYGAWILARFVLSRLRAGASVFPRRGDFKRESAAGGLEIKVHREPGKRLAVLSLAGRLDGASLPELKETVTLLAGARIHVVVDLAALESMDAAGVTAFIAGMKSAAECKVGFCVARAPPHCARTFEGAGIAGALLLVASVEEGERAVLGPSSCGPLEGRAILR
jgi:anti-anti-sigma factor